MDGSAETLMFWGGTLLGNLFGVAPWALLLLPLVVGAVVVAAFLSVTAVLAGLNAVLRGRRGPPARHPGPGAAVRAARARSPRRGTQPGS